MKKSGLMGLLGVCVVMLLYPEGALALEWTIRRVDTAGDVGVYTAIALDAANKPWISYGDLGNTDLKCARWTGTDWFVETVDPNAHYGSTTSLVLDEAGNPRIAYFTGSSGSGSLRYAYNDGFGWNTEKIANMTWHGTKCSLQLNGNGNPCIAYYESFSRDMRYASRQPSGWIIDTLEHAGTDIGDTCLRFDSDGNPNIVWSYVGSPGWLNYTVWTGSPLARQVVDTVPFGWYVSMALDRDDHPHIAYAKYSPLGLYDLCYAEWDGSSWNTETVDAPGSVGLFCSMALDSAGSPRIAYYDETNDWLKYTERIGEDWHIEVVDSHGDVGLYASLACDGNDNIHISYYDKTAGDLKYAWGVPEPVTVGLLAAGLGAVWIKRRRKA